MPDSSPGTVHQLKPLSESAVTKLAALAADLAQLQAAKFTGRTVLTIVYKDGGIARLDHDGTCP
jgi:hypothetical protein